ncbi:MAG: PAS domain-containing protein, partial [Methylococcaceae bacterium]|nr:PAS domain-containing protein [Methylococcaceae bacterium]
MTQSGTLVKNSWLSVLQILLLAGLYFVAGQASFSLSVAHNIVTLVVFTAEGFALAAVILLGTRLWMGVFLGQLVLALYNGLAWQLALGVSIINSLEAVIGAILFHRFALQPSLLTLRDVLGLLLLIFLILQPFSATLGNLLLWWGGVIQTAQLSTSWFSWWFGNALGQVLITPLLLCLFSSQGRIKKTLQNASWLTLLIIPASNIIFTNHSFSGIGITFAITIPLLILIAVKGGMAMVNLATLILAVTALLVTKQMRGVFVYDGTVLLLDLNIYLLSILLTGQCIAALLAERKRVENALLDSQALLHTAQRAARMGHYVTDSPTRTWTNDSLFDEIFGIDSQFIRNFDNWQHIIYCEDVERVLNYYHQTVNNHEKFPSIEYRIIRPNDGEMRWVAAWEHNFYDAKRNPLQQVGMVQDITERKLAEQQLHKSKEQLQLVLEGGYLGFWDWNIITNEVQRNEIWAEMLGYMHEEIQQSTQQWEDFIHPDDREKAWQSICNALEGRTAYHEMEYRMLHKDGSIKWVLDHASIVQRDTNGKPTRMSGTHTDITKLKRLEEQLRESENFFQLLAQINPVGIYRMDTEGNCIFVNPKGCEIIGMNSDQAKGAGWSTAIMADDRETVYKEWAAAVSEQRQFALEYRFQQPSGKITWVYGLATAIYDEAGNISGYVGTITDITERKTIEEHINQLAFYDYLTQLPNRRLLQ